MLQDKLRLQAQANSLEQRLEAVLQDKFLAKSFDAETPIDKTLAYLHSVIKVSSQCQHLLCALHVLSSRPDQQQLGAASPSIDTHDGGNGLADIGHVCVYSVTAQQVVDPLNTLLLTTCPSISYLPKLVMS